MAPDLRRPLGHTIGEGQARELARALRDRSQSVRAVLIRDWPIEDVRAAWLWIELHDHFPLVGAIRDLGEFIAARQGLRFCLGCGCTADNPCFDETGTPCCWIASYRCSACAKEEEGNPYGT
jgi:hypothetical protein